ncbi:MAG: TldD/PmbA family protein [Bacilli bacterium]|nr:TldD/PmbA family protein [Bacilli bacterium]
MQKKEFEKYLNLALSTGAEFAELYYEEQENRIYRLTDSKLDNIDTTNERGLGIRIVNAGESYYASTNILTVDNISNTIKKLLKNITTSKRKTVKLENKSDYSQKSLIPHNKYSINRKKDLLYKIDKIARKESKLVVQVSAGIVETDKKFTLANSNGKYISSNSTLTRIICTVYTQKGDIKEHEFIDYGKGMGYELLDEIDLEEMIKKATLTAVKKLDAIDFKGGELPVVIAPGFGAVIFHEACGHGLEATSVAPKLSVFSYDLGKKVATEKVTLIDDGTIKNAWGSFIVDDEGNKSNKNILIENGILKHYLVDDFNSKEMQMNSNGCGRRQNYHYATTSRMSNTYLKPGNDKIDDMIKSIDLGVFCEKMSGGSVNPATGDFNFAVDTARLIKNGELKEYLKGITLIGNSKDILNNVEMVSDDLKISAGYCGSKSGMIPVTIGQPTIKVSKILVGGKE